MAKKPEIKLFEQSEYCPGFWYINAISGCPYHCSTCYLDASTGRYNNDKKIISIADETIADRIVSKWLDHMPDEPIILNTGETGDSWAFNKAIGMNYRLMTRFMGADQQLLFLTKSSNRAMLVPNAINNIIYSFSINPPIVCAEFSSPIVSLGLLEQLQKQGKRLRFRLDPILPVENWKYEYQTFIEVYFKNAISRSLNPPEMFTLGSLRLTENNYKLRLKQSNKLLKYVTKEETGMHPYRVPYQLRKEIYSFIIYVMRQTFPNARIGLCKEPKKMRDELGIKREDCNCLI